VSSYDGQLPTKQEGHRAPHDRIKLFMLYSSRIKKNRKSLEWRIQFELGERVGSKLFSDSAEVAFIEFDDIHLLQDPQAAMDTRGC
jgi:hypothetical protein